MYALTFNHGELADDALPQLNSKISELPLHPLSFRNAQALAISMLLLEL